MSSISLSVAPGGSLPGRRPSVEHWSRDRPVGRAAFVLRRRISGTPTHRRSLGWHRPPLDGPSTSRAPKRVAFERLPSPSPGGRLQIGKWPRSNRKRWPTSFRYQWPTRGICTAPAARCPRSCRASASPPAGHSGNRVRMRSRCPEPVLWLSCMLRLIGNSYVLQR